MRGECETRSTQRYTNDTKAFVSFASFRVLRVSKCSRRLALFFEYLDGVQAMSDRIDKRELVDRVSRRVGKGTGTVGGHFDAALEEICEALKQGEIVSLRNFGTFYVRPERSSWVFKFNPSQRLRKLFGWSSTYKGKL